MAYLPQIPINLFHIDINNLSKNMRILYNFSFDIILMLIIFLIYKKNIITDFKNYFKKFSENFETSFKYYFIGLIIMITTNVLIIIFLNNANANNENLIREYINLYPLYMLFSISIYAPFVEELIFRKSIHDIFLPYKNNFITKYLYIITSGFIFASLHVVGLSKNIIDYIYIIPYLSLGITFAALYHKTNNIFSTIIIHSMHNTITLILYIMAGIMS